ncbi:MAG: hypothetical protein OXC05_14700 [Halieaceae bacterium]|nr:hypothetical protein [Halieaceae bacterium]
MNLPKKSGFIFFILLSTVTCAIANDNGVTMKNVENFKAEFSRELISGISKEKVESYLSELNLEHSYVDSEKKYYAIVRKVGWSRIIFESNLLIRIHLDTSYRVEKIEYELEYNGL